MVAGQPGTGQGILVIEWGGIEMVYVLDVDSTGGEGGAEKMR
jgi:hypothetical protein